MCAYFEAYKSILSFPAFLICARALRRMDSLPAATGETAGGDLTLLRGLHVLRMLHATAAINEIR